MLLADGNGGAVKELPTTEPTVVTTATPSASTTYQTETQQADQSAQLADKTAVGGFAWSSVLWALVIVVVLAIIGKFVYSKIKK